jgi:hypothetical protein
MRQPEVQSNCLFFAGPFLGELGWEISHWVPHLRWLRKDQVGKRIAVASYPGRHPLYYNIADEFFPLPDWFIDKHYEVDCFEALCPNAEYGRLLNYFRSIYNNKYSEVIESRTPRGYNKVLRNAGLTIFDNLKHSVDAEKTYQQLMASTIDKPPITFFARNVDRKNFLDIFANQPSAVCDVYKDGLPSRNWPASFWNILFERLYKRYSDEFTFVIGGTREGNSLVGVELPGVINLTNLDVSISLDVTIGFLRHSLCSISSQSGPSHLSLQSGCPSFIYGHEHERHAITDNPLGTEVMFFETSIGGYADPPELLEHDIGQFIEHLKPLRLKPQKPVQKISDKVVTIEEPTNQDGGLEGTADRDGKLLVGMVGVFDKQGSTNIPFASAFSKHGHTVQVVNYRTVAGKYGIDAMDHQIIELSKRVDLIIFCKCNGVKPEILRECDKHATTCWYMMDAVTHLGDKNYFEFGNICDFSVVTTSAMRIALIDGGVTKPIYHLIQGISPDEYHPTNVPEKTCDVVFIGTKSAKRDTILDSIEHWGYSVKRYGHGYGGVVKGEEFNTACSEGRICIAINNTDSSIRSCVISEYSKGMRNYFTPGNHLFWFDDLSYLQHLLKTLVPAKKERERVASNGYRKVLSIYTWDHVASDIIWTTLNLNQGENDNEQR